MQKYNLLIPGRHHLLTNFQFKYLNHIVRKKENIKDIIWRNGKKLNVSGYIDQIIWTITSSNHQNTKRNPLPGFRRDTIINDFSKSLPVESLIYHIDDIWLSDRFESYISKKIFVDTNMSLDINPNNTIVLTSTPQIAKNFMDLWFEVLPAEYDITANKYWELAPRPIFEKILALLSDWKNPALDDEILDLVHPSTIDIYNKYDIRNHIKTINQDKILLQDWDLTATRDYNSYARSFDEGSKRKYDYISADIKAWKILDIWCCTGGLLKEIWKDSKFHESDLYGIDIIPKFIQRCENDKLLWLFKNENTFFLQKNIIENQIFPENFADTAISFALTHELISYDSYDKLKLFMQNLYHQINLGGRRINFDVIWPDNLDQIVIAELSKNDGYDFDQEKFDNIYMLVLENYDNNQIERKKYISWLNTYGRFLLFVRTFRQKQWDRKCNYEEIWDSKINIKNQDLCEFMSKKDYTDNRLSEMNEYFCYMNFAKRKELAEEVWFTVNSESELIYNERIYEHSYKNSIKIYDLDQNPLSYPATNIKLILDK